MNTNNGIRMESNAAAGISSPPAPDVFPMSRLTATVIGAMFSFPPDITMPTNRSFQTHKNWKIPNAAMTHVTTQGGECCRSGTNASRSPRSPARFAPTRRMPPPMRAGAFRGCLGGDLILSGRRLRDLHQELDVGAGLAQPIEQQVEGLLRVEGVQHPAQLDRDGQ